MPTKDRILSLIKKPVKVQQVYADNLESEFENMKSVIDSFPVISMDTEYPGTVYFLGDKNFSPPEESAPESYKLSADYWSLRRNVDGLKLIQVGITLSDSDGNLPDLGSENQVIWEFNFKDFDVNVDVYNKDSIKLLKKNGMDFEKNRTDGIDSYRFAELMMSSGLLCNDAVSWVTFQGSCDFGYLVKILTSKPLPRGIREFLSLLRVYFGTAVYDVKHLCHQASLYGGLDQVARTLTVKRVVGNCHQAGSDSLLTCHTFHKIKQEYFRNNGLEKYAGVLSGFEVF